MALLGSRLFLFLKISNLGYGRRDRKKESDGGKLSRTYLGLGPNNLSRRKKKKTLGETTEKLFNFISSEKLICPMGYNSSYKKIIEKLPTLHRSHIISKPLNFPILRF